jgi:hypothetical protein
MEARSSKIKDGSAVPRLEAKGTTTANNSATLEEIKVCTQAEAPPWICQQGCGKAPATCGKTVQQCEHALFMQNESERFAPCYRRQGRRAAI